MKTKSDKAGQMLSRPVGRTIISMAVPSITAYVINSIYSLTDTYFVSTLGTNATAAVGVNNSLDVLIFFFGIAFAVGATSYISRLLGARDNERANHVMATSFFTAVGIGCIVLILGVAFITPLVQFLGATPTCQQYSIDYATYVLLAAPFASANAVLTQTLRGEGSATLSLVGTGASAILNVGLDAWFIKGLSLGVMGASLATAISKVVCFMILVAPYVLKHTQVRLSIKYFRFDGGIYKEVIKVGAGSAFRGLFMIVAGIVTNKLAGMYSDSVLAAVSVTTKIMKFPMDIILGFSAGFQPVLGYNWGAKEYSRVKGCVRFASIVSLSIGAVMAVILIVLVKPIIGIFTVADEEMLAFGTMSIIMQSIVLPIHSWEAIPNGYCAALGNGVGAFILSISRQGLCYLPFIFPAVAIFGVDGLAGIQAFADLVALIPALIFFARNNKKVLAEEISSQTT